MLLSHRLLLQCWQTKHWFPCELRVLHFQRFLGSQVVRETPFSLLLSMLFICLRIGSLGPCLLFALFMLLEKNMLMKRLPSLTKNCSYVTQQYLERGFKCQPILNFKDTKLLESTFSCFIYILILLAALTSVKCWVCDLSETYLGIIS